jgi:hypothetical protein
MIEAAIVGRPVLAIQAPEFAGTQEGTLHYRHLLPENGGFLRVSSSFPEHLSSCRACCTTRGVARRARSLRAVLRQAPWPGASLRRSVSSRRIERMGRSRHHLPRVHLRESPCCGLLLRPVAACGGLWLSPSCAKQASRPKQKAAKTRNPLREVFPAGECAGMNAVADRGGATTATASSSGTARGPSSSRPQCRPNVRQFSIAMLVTLARGPRRARHRGVPARSVSLAAEWFQTWTVPPFEPLRGRLAAWAVFAGYLDRTSSRMTGTRRSRAPGVEPRDAS